MAQQDTQPIILTALSFLTALSIAAVAAWFSIIGLMYIFAASALSIAIMAIVLEVGKLVTASWLWWNWKASPFLLKSYLITALIVLMLITSLGIFGYLSRAHIEAGAPVGDDMALVERIDQQIAVEERSLERNERMVTQLDRAIDEMIERGFATRGLQTREAQAEERAAIARATQESIARIEELAAQRFEVNQRVRNFETEIGPIKYVAALLYENPDDHIESAVRGIILLLVFVFDPLAVLLLIAANFSLKRHLEARGVITSTPKKVVPKAKTEFATTEEPVVDNETDTKYHERSDDKVPTHPGNHGLQYKQLREKNIR